MSPFLSFLLTWIDHGHDGHWQIDPEGVGVEEAEAGQGNKGVAGTPSLWKEEDKKSSFIFVNMIRQV